ncbi:MAG: glutamate--cysteine ligase [Magnetococcales bacterium]|nr:glutamate--cysteine ligase [Magnetococcales bacterium]
MPANPVATGFDQPEPITDHRKLIAYLESGCKPRQHWCVGTEHEQFVFHKQTLQPVAYEGTDGIQAILQHFVTQFGWTPIFEQGLPIALQQGTAAITLEPGGQFELSGAPLPTIHQTKAELATHIHQLSSICQIHHIGFLGIGTQPKWPFDAIPWMPKGRYQQMRAYLPNKGHLALDMMTRTTTIQASLDFHNESDMVAKFRLALALQPLITALFANSPFIDGQPTGRLSHRAEIWRHTDPDRCGWLPFVFAEGFGFERYADYALATPMLFLLRQHRYHPVGGAPFKHFLTGSLPDWPGHYPTLEDWTTHLTTLFPDVRLKHYLEMRGADGGNQEMICALPAFWKGILYDDSAMAAAWDLVKQWSLTEREQIHSQVARLGLATPVPGSIGTLRQLALEVLAIASLSLQHQQQYDSNGQDESIYLEPLLAIASSGITPAQRLLEAYHGPWRGDVNQLFKMAETCPNQS